MPVIMRSILLARLMIYHTLRQQAEMVINTLFHMVLQFHLQLILRMPRHQRLKIISNITDIKLHLVLEE